MCEIRKAGEVRLAGLDCVHLSAGVSVRHHLNWCVERTLRGLMKHPINDYRERSLKIHGMICAKCGREFTHRNRQLLTVHHKDGNSRNNPADGSNWENLCVYCHEDEHSRKLLGEYLGGE